MGEMMWEWLWCCSHCEKHYLSLKNTRTQLMRLATNPPLTLRKNLMDSKKVLAVFHKVHLPGDGGQMRYFAA
jgi:hypothetical protein